MMIVNLIVLGVIVLCLAVVIFMVVRKFPQISQIDTENMPKTKEDKTKERIIREKLERSISAKIRAVSQRTRPLAKGVNSFSKSVFNKILELERKYRRRLEPKTLEEKEKVEEKTGNLVEDGFKLMAEERFGEAERCFIDAIALDPKNAEAYRGLGELYWEQGKLDEAKETYAFLLKLNADSYDAYSHLGNIARSQGELEKARDYHLKSIELDSQAAVHYLELSQVYQEMEELESAFECLEKAVGLEPNNPRNLDALLNLSIIMGKKNEAEEVLAKLKEANPENQKIAEFEERVGKMN